MEQLDGKHLEERVDTLEGQARRAQSTSADLERMLAMATQEADGGSANETLVRMLRDQMEQILLTTDQVSARVDAELVTLTQRVEAVAKSYAGRMLGGAQEEKLGIQVSGLPPQYSKQAAEQRSNETGGSTMEAAPHGRWKVLMEIPSFSVGGGETWECNMRLQAWWLQFQTISTTVSPGFGAYVHAEYAVAEQKHQKRLTGQYNLPDLTPVLPEHQEYENRLMLTLILCLPQEVQQPVLEKTGSSKLRGVHLLECIFQEQMPGGQQEMKSIQAFVRHLDPAYSAKEGLETLRRWKLARTRARDLQLPAVASFEEVQALSSLIRNVERRSAQEKKKKDKPCRFFFTPAGDIPIDFLDELSEAIAEARRVRLQRQPLWWVHLDPDEYSTWSSTGHIQSRACRPFRGETSPFEVAVGVFLLLERQDQVFPTYDFDISETQRIVEAHDLLIMREDQVVRPGYIAWLMDLEEDTEILFAVVESSSRPGRPEVA
ncbi:TY1B-NL2 [Symbiodinium natans]|uniref:TY1B-NL2 protein n=1 Tax=Symbiodinium natans TaxID=878477 RepID=A0A812UHN4_9DINO|nr:TY1B-NL2 [Symbiodinium natans]